MTDFSMETTWDGLSIAQETPYGAAVVVYRRGPEGFRYLLVHRKHLGPDCAGDWAWGPPAGCRLPAVEAAALCLPALVGDQLLGVARLIGDPQV